MHVCAHACMMFMSVFSHVCGMHVFQMYGCTMCSCVHGHLKLTLRVLISLHLIHWGRVSQLSPELDDVASLTSRLAPGTPCLCPLSAGTGGRSSCPPGIYIGSGEMQLSGQCLCDKHSNRWTIPSPNLCFWNFHKYIYIFFNHIHSCYLLLPPYAELIKKFLMFFCLFVCLLLNVLAQVGKKICLCLKGRWQLCPEVNPTLRAALAMMATDSLSLLLLRSKLCYLNLEVSVLKITCRRGDKAPLLGPRLRGCSSLPHKAQPHYSPSPPQTPNS